MTVNLDPDVRRRVALGDLIHTLRKEVRRGQMPEREEMRAREVITEACLAFDYPDIGQDLKGEAA